MPQNKRVWVAYSKALLQVYHACDPRGLDEIIPGDKILIHFNKPQRNAFQKQSQGASKVAIHLKLQEENSSDRSYCSLFSSIQKVLS